MYKYKSGDKVCYKDVDDWEYNITIMSVTYNHMKDAQYQFLMPSGEKESQAAST